MTAAALYLESFGNAPKFARFARRFAERKPLLAVVGGRSSGGRRAGASHTAAAASPAMGVDALFAQAGVITCTGAEDMSETALLLGEQPLPRGKGSPYSAMPEGWECSLPTAPTTAAFTCRSSPLRCATGSRRTSPARLAPATRSTPARVPTPVTLRRSAACWSLPWRSTL